MSLVLVKSCPNKDHDSLTSTKLTHKAHDLEMGCARTIQDRFTIIQMKTGVRSQLSQINNLINKQQITCPKNISDHQNTRILK